MELIRTNRYRKDMKRIGASATDMAKVEREIATNPAAGDVVPGLGGIRKLRFALGDKGKRGGGRVIYFVVVADDQAVLLYAYAKAAQTDMTEAEKRAAVAILKEFADG